MFRFVVRLVIKFSQIPFNLINVHQELKPSPYSRAKMLPSSSTFSSIHKSEHATSQTRNSFLLFPHSLKRVEGHTCFMVWVLKEFSCGVKLEKGMKGEGLYAAGNGRRWK